MNHHGYDRRIDVTLPKTLTDDPRAWDLSRHLEEVEDPSLDDAACGLHLDLVRETIRHLLEDSPYALPGRLTPEEKNAMDGWFASRLHAALRIPRRLASRPSFWAWVAIDHAGDYVRRRFAEPDGSVARWRYTGGLLRNAVSRLWWGAEMGRDGEDYGAVPTIFARTRTAQWALELRYSGYRPAAIAFARVAEGLDDGDRKLNDAEAKALSVRANALLSLRALEAVGLDEPDPDDDFGASWRRERPSLEELLNDEGPRGPLSGQVSQEASIAMERWLRSLAERSEGEAA